MLAITVIETVIVRHLNTHLIQVSGHLLCRVVLLNKLINESRRHSGNHLNRYDEVLHIVSYRGAGTWILLLFYN